VKGAGRGKQIGVPTANLHTQSELYPGGGVYLTKTTLRGQVYKSVSNVGTNPTFVDGAAIQVETHLLHFDQDIYGEKIKVEFLDYIRPEKKFGSVQELISQINQDIDVAQSSSVD
jgi:riboflavin kinase/FMN adenylyltransferase